MANQSYIRSDEDGNPAVPQPASTPGTVDPGAGWETKPYLDFNGDYVRHDDDGNVAPVPQPYQKRDEDGNPIVAQPYQRHDDDGNPI